MLLDLALLGLLIMASAGAIALSTSRKVTVIAIAESCLQILLPAGLALVVTICVAVVVIG